MSVAVVAARLAHGSLHVCHEPDGGQLGPVSPPRMQRDEDEFSVAVCEFRHQRQCRWYNWYRYSCSGSGTGPGSSTGTKTSVLVLALVLVLVL